MAWTTKLATTDLVTSKDAVQTTYNAQPSQHRYHAHAHRKYLHLVGFVWLHSLVSSWTRCTSSIRTCPLWMVHRGCEHWATFGQAVRDLLPLQNAQKNCKQSTTTTFQCPWLNCFLRPNLTWPNQRREWRTIRIVYAKHCMFPYKQANRRAARNYRHKGNTNACYNSGQVPLVNDAKLANLQGYQDRQAWMPFPPFSLVFY